uniref:Large ribosomal subunit protein bL21m n=1 Tax=Cacopsylla melanoneura TaxID=428564 RepID=A0A8D9BDC9_9HEMI
MVFLNMIPRTLSILSSSLVRSPGLIVVSNSIISRNHLNKFLYSTTPSIDKLKLQQEIVLDAAEEKQMAQEVIEQVNSQIERNEQGRLFAIIHILGRQTKVTPDDIIIVDSNSFAPLNGDKIKFEKVLLVGGADFTLVGRPLLTPGLVNVTGTIIEKDLSHTRTNFRKIPRKRHMRFRFFRTQLTMIRINEIEIKEKVAQRKDVEGGDRLIS